MPRGRVDTAAVSSEVGIVVMVAGDREDSGDWSDTGTDGEGEGDLANASWHSGIDVKVSSSFTSNLTHFTG